MNKIFMIRTQNTDYVMGVGDDGILRHIHYGEMADGYKVELTHEQNSNHSALDYAKQEYTPHGGTMYRGCALKCTFADNCREVVLAYESSRESDGKTDIVLSDKEYGLAVELQYRYSKDSDIIARRTVLRNESESDIKLERTMSAEINLPTRKPYYAINYNGSWGAEFRTTGTEVKAGTLTFESRKGTAGHTHSPAIILHNYATEDNGDVYFATLGYGGSFRVDVSRDFIGVTRAMLGINDFDSDYNLKSGEEFATPWVYIGYCKGFAAMSNMMNRYAIDNILPQSFAHKPLPVLYNSWEATGFDVSTKGQLELAALAADIGCELFVMDDGWFGERNNDWAGLGDWYINKEKFPNGLDELIDGVNALGMDFGLWFEPEMVQKNSDLYRAHPEWAYHYPTRVASELRHQRVLNLTIPEVEEHVFNCMDEMLCRHNIKYIKWDMNRPFSELGTPNLDNPREVWYRHTMAVYRIADKLKAKHPDLQIEACSSGGGRAEYGAMSHFDMIWTSDNTDPVDRLDIQRGYSLLYPRKCMRAWVTDSNSGSRPVDLQFRYNVSMQGSLSIGANLTKYTEKEMEISRKNIALYKDIRNIVQFGDMYRLADYGNDGFYATQYVDRDKNESVVFICSNANNFFNSQFLTYRLKGLDPEKTYSTDGEQMSGARLMRVDSVIRLWAPLQSRIIRLKAVE